MTRMDRLPSRSPRRRPPVAVALPLERRTLLAGVSFAAPAAYGSGSAHGVVTADLNGDGKPDVVTANSASTAADGVAVLTNTVGGFLGGGIPYTTSSPALPGLQPFAVVSADFNGDGHADVASANVGSDTMSVLLGDGDGGLGAPAVYAAGQSPFAIAAGRLTAGALPDLVVANFYSDAVSVFLNSGSGAFAPAVNYPVGVNPIGVVMADVNGDGHLDLVVANSGATTFSVLLNAGDGTFAPALTVAGIGAPSSVAVADVNGDGKADIIAADVTGSSVDVLRGHGDGTFGAATQTPIADDPRDLVLGDFNGDGVTDVAVAEQSPHAVGVFLGNGDGTFAPEASFPTGVDSFSLATADLDGDGRADLIVGAYVDSGLTPTVAVLLNTGPSTPTPTPTKTIGGLDPTFGSSGLASHDVGLTSTVGVAADGTQSVLAGPTGASPAQAFGVARYNADGSVDATFGTAGVASAAFAGTDAVPSAVAVLADGDILVAGTASTRATDGTVAGSQFAVAEFTAAGALDPTFGTGGEAMVGFGSALSNDVLNALAVGPGGVIYLGGQSDAAGKGNADLAVAALTATGALERSFNATGTALVDLDGGDDVANALAVQQDGAVVAAGSATVGGVGEVALVRLTPAGALDARFGSKGTVTSKVGGDYDAAESVAIGPKGVIVVGGLTAGGTDASPTSDFLVQRYTSAGKADRSFGAGGTTVTSFGQPAAVTQVAVGADGSVVASGRTAANVGGTLDVAVARDTARGAADTSFNATGKVVVDLASGTVAVPGLIHVGSVGFFSSRFGALAITAGGEILSAGNSGSRSVEARLVATGVDLVAKVPSVLPASTLGGAKGTATVTVTEAGTTRAVGAITITLAFATDATGTGAVTVKTSATKVNLRQGQTKAYRLPFAYPSGLASGAYYLVATVTDDAGLAAELNAANNTVASASAVQIAPPFVSLAGSGLTAGSAFVAGKAVTVSLTVANGGNVTAKGKTAVSLYLSTDGTVAGGTKVADVPLAVGLAAGKSKASRFRITLPAGTAAGTFQLLAVLDPDRSLGSVDQTNATVVDRAPVSVG